MKRCPRRVAGALLSASLAVLANSAPAPAQTPPASPPATVSAQPPQVQPPLSSPDSRAVRAPDDNSQPVSSPSRPQRDLSPWSMFLAADIVVKAVMASLALASLATWTIFFAKTAQLSRAQRRLRAALTRITDARTLSEAHMALNGGDTALSALVRAALHEVRLSGDGASDAGIKERSASRFSEIARAEARAMRHGMAMLATIGATAPFVGLFGTVWGIMNSFIGISKAQTTNLAVVAPGIAEALLATAIGLVAAIPAVIVYNHFSRATKSYLDYVGRGSGAVGRLLSRDLDRARDRLLARAAE